MVTTNIDIDYRLINGQIDAVCKIATDSHGKVSKIYLKLDEDKAGLTQMMLLRILLSEINGLHP